jgi:hypothetical protein
MRKSINLIFSLLILISFGSHFLIAQNNDSLSSDMSSQPQEVDRDTKNLYQETNKNHMITSFKNFYSSKTTTLHSIGFGVGDQLSLWYYYLAPLINLERIKFVSFGLGFGGKGVNYVTYKENLELVNDTDQSYFFFLGGSVGFTFFITERIFLHSAGGAEYWFGDSPSGYGYIYEYREGFDGGGGFKPMITIGLFSIIPTSKHSTTSIGLAYNYNCYNYKSYSIVFTFY